MLFLNAINLLIDIYLDIPLDRNARLNAIILVYSLITRQEQRDLRFNNFFPSKEGKMCYKNLVQDCIIIQLDSSLQNKISYFRRQQLILVNSLQNHMIQISNLILIQECLNLFTTLILVLHMIFIMFRYLNIMIFIMFRQQLIKVQFFIIVFKLNLIKIALINEVMIFIKLDINVNTNLQCLNISTRLMHFLEFIIQQEFKRFMLKVTVVIKLINVKLTMDFPKRV
ncbi:unnamed protein product [Paramecium pentaurelia]|uniref:Transmembrane protein n=1 Tax=Paramecium pentaurelia TaxID=43138 RepID=A0A8S1UYL2_9CILI|nr:unnamed protein product [Paramecium pentaurelia]